MSKLAEVSPPRDERWTWYLWGVPIGTSPCVPHYVHAQEYFPQNIAYFCPDTGEIWARIYRPSATRWGILSRPSNPGFLLPFNEQWTPDAPYAVLARELNLIAAMPDPSRYEISLLMRNYL